MGDREKIEILLRNFRGLKSSIRIELTRDFPEYSLESISFIKTDVDANSFHSKVEDYVVAKCSPDHLMVKKLQVIEIIQAAYDSLNLQQKKIITDMYFEERSLLDVAGELDWNEKTIRRRRDNIFSKLKSVGILNAWQIWLKILKMSAKCPENVH